MKVGASVLQYLGERVLIFDGAMGTQIQDAGLTPNDFVLNESATLSESALAAARRLNGKSLEGCNELLCLTRPDVIEAIHTAYLDAGADLIETNTFGTTSVVLAEYDLQDIVFDLASEAAKIARRAADAKSTKERPRFVIGAIGPGTKLVSLGQASFDEIEATYTVAFRALLEGGADALMLETLQDLLMAKASIVAARNAMEHTGIQKPLFVQITMEQTGTMLLGSEIGAALNMIECFPEVQVIGINCATGPVEMAPHVRYLAQNSTRPISVQPNAGLPVMEKGQGVYKLTSSQLTEWHRKFVEEYGVAMIGGCCGTTPAHILDLSENLSHHPHVSEPHWRKVQKVFPGFDFSVRSQDQAASISLVGCSSLYNFQPYRQDASFLIIGEKTNANGSKAFREMLSHENWEGLTELARELESEGSHVLDVCTAYVGRDEVRDMHILLGKYNRHVTVPIMIDSTEVPVIETALRSLAGKPIVNSINFEDGGKRLERVLDLCKKYGAAVVGLTIDENGMAKTCDEKVQIAERILEKTRATGIPDHDVFIDCLTFTLGSGDEEFRRAGIETINAIDQIRSRRPLVNTILGVSNISFGLKPAARQVLNSAFLHYALEAGLTSAIVHFSKIQPENKIEHEIWKIASDVVFDKRTFANAS